MKPRPAPMTTAAARKTEPTKVEEENGESDGEGGARMIAWEGGVVGAAAPDMGGRVRCEGALAVPDLADRLS